MDCKHGHSDINEFNKDIPIEEIVNSLEDDTDEISADISISSISHNRRDFENDAIMTDKDNESNNNGNVDEERNILIMTAKQ